jgi:ribosomal-protein-alanine N-acetyltransferase
MLWNKAPATVLPNYYATKLSGPRVLLRPPQMRDYKVWAAVRGANQMNLKPYEPTWGTSALSEGFYMARLSKQKTDWLTDAAYAFLIFTPDGRNVLGGVNINHVARGAAQHATLGYWLDKAHEGQGLMREALGLLIVFSRDQLRLHRLHAATLPGNHRSRKLLEGLGFEEEGYARSYVQIDGKWADHVLYGTVLAEHTSPEA